MGTNNAGNAWLSRSLVVCCWLGLAGALVGVVPSGVSAVPAHLRCRPTAFVTNRGSGTVSKIDVKTRNKNPEDITVGVEPGAISITPDGKTAFVTDNARGTVSTIDLKTGTKNPNDITVGLPPSALAITPDGKAVVITNGGSGTVSTIDVKTRSKDPNDIAVGTG